MAQKKPKEKDFYIVGIGASAGGLRSFTDLLGNIPKDIGMSFVLVQHLSPDVKSSLTEILSTKTDLPITEVQKDIEIKSGNVYIIPPNKNIIVENNILKLSSRKPGINLPINTFFTSLAKYKKQNAIGLILSGTGSDGTLGAQAIREAGGITFAQDDTAEFSNMPENAIKTKAIDYVLNPVEMAEMLSKIAKDPSFKYVTTSHPELPEGEADDLAKILLLLAEWSSVDFTYYKHGTIQRRILRRMLMHNIKNYAQYFAYLSENPKEVEQLYQDLLIKVTNFFRDKKVFEFLEKKLFPRLVKNKVQENASSIRIWVPGCSTGEEVYSLAISLYDYIERNNIKISLQFFGTDLSELALQKARRGRYSRSIEQFVSPEFLSKYFKKIDDDYVINQNIRDICLFAKHNMIADTPFSKLDMISCRNVLIYLDSILQKRAIPIFHYALNPKGFLVLGTAETTATFQDLFEILDKECRIYTRKSAPVHLPFEFRFPITSETKMNKANKKNNLNLIKSSILGIEKEADQIIASRHSSPGVIINDDLTIIQFRGDTSPYIHPSVGRATLNLVKMTHKKLLISMLEGIANARKKGVPVKIAVASMKISLEVIPLGGKSVKEKHFLILFENNIDAKKDKNSPLKRNSTTKNSKILELEKELETTAEHLQALIEKQDSTNEELRSANEEIMSSNEELHSTNEELMTAKEELQSTNEELMTLNTELQNRNVELRRIDEERNKVIEQLEWRTKELSRKDEFISILGHELRNPLTPILHSTEIAKLHGISDPEIKEQIDIIERQARHMSELLNSLLDVARAMGGRIKIHVESVNINRLVQNAIETASPYIERYQHELEVHLPDAPINIVADPLRVEQILVNVLNNAAKFTKPGGHITVIVAEKEESVFISIEDTGRGISKEMMPKIFNLFAQAGEPLAGFKDGLGIGLMLARNLAELHGGSLTAKSEGPDKGSEFILRIPVKQTDMAPISSEPDLKSLKFRKSKILLVDDNISVADSLGKLLKNLDQEVKVVYDGVSAIDALRIWKPNIIIIDISMPVMDGYQLLEILKKDSSLHDATFVALSGFGEEMVQQSLEAGFKYHFLKPISPKDLKKILS
jgi:chemotaxis methyl-accepting protein methylase/signal transduction histidine kinase/chemotaxis response regulator CheB